MLIVAVAFGILLVTYSVVLIIGVSNSADNIVVSGTIDLNKFETSFFVIIGGGLVILGIKVAPTINTAMRKSEKA